MGKMIGTVEGADMYLIVALLIFLMVFILAIIYIVSLSKDQIKELSHLPLTNQNELNHEEK